MARIAVPVTQVKVAGVTPPAQTAGNASENHQIEGNDGRIYVEVENVDAAATHTITFLTPGSAGGAEIEDPAIVVGKSAKVLAGPFAPQVFNQSNGQLFVNVNSSELKLRAYRV